jgi:hypothetical protein
MDLRKSAGAPTLISEAPVLADVLLVTHRIESGSASQLCVPKIRFCNIGGEGHQELGVM